MKITSFHRNIMPFLKDIPSAYYIPLKFGLKAVDAIYVEVNECQNTAMVVVIQITVSQWHKDSSANLFAQWDQWTNLLKFFTITLIFLSIVEEMQGRADVEEKLRELRTGKETSACHSLGINRSSQQKGCRHSGTNWY